MSIVKFKTSGNISLKENKIFFLFSQIENQRFSTSLNNNIPRLRPNPKICSNALLN